MLDVVYVLTTILVLSSVLCVGLVRLSAICFLALIRLTNVALNIHFAIASSPVSATAHIALALVGFGLLTIGIAADRRAYRIWQNEEEKLFVQAAAAAPTNWIDLWYRTSESDQHRYRSIAMQLLNTQEPRVIMGLKVLMPDKFGANPYRTAE